MAKVYTVRQVNFYVKNMFTQDFMLNSINVKGEISNCTYASSGHIYFSLKDESGIMSCVMFKGARIGLSFDLNEGQQVIVSGSVSFYERDGKVQLYANKITLDGIGLLYEKFEKLKKELAEKGMFSAEYKMPIPPFVKTLGVVTSETGAVIQDIIQVAKRRNPYIQIILHPTKVQGEGAKESIVRGIGLLEEAGVDVIIVGRGGGSIEDLWAFNEEEVANAVFRCLVPVISAVGHETDTTMIDFVADMRAPTPSAAAEMAVYKHQDVKNYILQMKLNLDRRHANIIERYKKQCENLRLRLKHGHPRQRLNEKNQRLLDLENRIRQNFEKKVNKDKQQLSILIEKMKGLSPLNKLNQGYAYVRSQAGVNIRSISQVSRGDELEVIVTDGRIYTKVEGIK
jgi:exodeoxyribonuclease VII large subunit